MQNIMYEVYDTRDGRRIAHCGWLQDAINLSRMGEFRNYREYPVPTLQDQVIDVTNLYNPQIMPSQQRLDPTPHDHRLLTENDQIPLNLY